MTVLIYINTSKQVGDPKTPRKRGSRRTIPKAWRLSMGSWSEKEALMRILALAILAIVSIGPAGAQTYDPAYPVCLHVWTWANDYYDCTYTTLPQCNASASGRSAQCLINPYFAGAKGPGGYRRHRRVY
jgi:hypothetical protein